MQDTSAMTCPVCGSVGLIGHVHKASPYNNLAEFEKDAAEIAKVVQNLHDKYPTAITYCPICGQKL